jgi:hypothetical protein
MLGSSTALMAQVSVSHTGCFSFNVSIPTSSGPCTNCYSQTPLNNTNKMFVEFRLLRKVGSSYTMDQIISQTNSFSASFSVPVNSANTYKVEAYISSAASGCVIALRDPNTGQLSCIGQWDFFDETDDMEIGQPNLLVQDIDTDSNNNGTHCYSNIIANGGVLMNSIISFADRGWQVQICQENQFGTGCDNWTHTGWQSGELPQNLNLLTDVWQQNHPSWQFWAGKTFTVTVAIKNVPCDGWFSRQFSFTVVNSGC